MVASAKKNNETVNRSELMLTNFINLLSKIPFTSDVQQFYISMLILASLSHKTLVHRFTLITNHSSRTPLSLKDSVKLDRSRSIRGTIPLQLIGHSR